MTLTPSLVLDEMSAARRGAAFTSPVLSLPAYARRWARVSANPSFIHSAIHFPALAAFRVVSIFISHSRPSVCLSWFCLAGRPAVGVMQGRGAWEVA